MMGVREIYCDNNFMMQSNLYALHLKNEQDIYTFCFPDGSHGKKVSAMQETWVQSLGKEDSLEKGMATLPPPQYCRVNIAKCWAG